MATTTVVAWGGLGEVTKLLCIVKGLYTKAGNSDQDTQPAQATLAAYAVSIRCDDYQCALDSCGVEIRQRLAQRYIDAVLILWLIA